MEVLLQAYWILALASVVISTLLAWQTWEHRRFVRSRVCNPSMTPCRGRVAVLIPCKGADSDLEANLRPLFEQEHADYELVFVVESLADAAAGVIRRLIGQYPACTVKLVIAGIATAHGQKVHNLLAATRDLDPRVRILVFLDADVRPPRHWLRHLTQRLNECIASTGYRWFVPARPSLAGSLLSSVNAAVIPLMFPGLHHKVWGGSWAIRREVFEASGLREAWCGTLSDDLVAGNVLASLQRRINVEPSCIVASPIDVDLRGAFHFVRRQYTIGRFYSRGLWTFLLVYCCATQAIFWGGVAALVVGLAMGASWTWQPAVATTLLYALHVFRGWLRQRASMYFVGDRWQELAAARRFDILLAPVTGLAISVAMIASAVGRHIVWKDIRYEMLPGGKVAEIIRNDQVDRAVVPDHVIAPESRKVAA